VEGGTPDEADVRPTKPAAKGAARTSRVRQDFRDDCCRCMTCAIDALHSGPRGLTRTDRPLRRSLGRNCRVIGPVGDRTGEL